jgi:predicted Zn-dependent protease
MIELDKRFLCRINGIIKFFESKEVFIEFYIYYSIYNRYDLISEKKLISDYIEKGISALIKKHNKEEYLYIDSFDLNEISKEIFKTLDTEEIIIFNENFKIKQTGFGDNYLESEKYKNQLKEYKNQFKNDSLNYIVNTDYEEIIIFNKETCIFDRRNFQKLFIMENKRIIDSYSTNNNIFIGELYKKRKKNNIKEKKLTLRKKINAWGKIDYNYILLLPKASGIIAHEVCGHMLENDYFTSTNPFYKKFGKQISNIELTVHDNPDLLYDNTSHVDDEGFELKKITLIKDGKLVGLLGCNHVIANKHLKYYHRARRESHQYISTGRSFCITIESRNHNFDDIKDIEAEVLVIQDFFNTSFDSETNIISCKSNNLSIIKNGEFLPIKASIDFRANGDTILKSIKYIFNDSEYYENMCLSSSGSVSNSTFTPSLLFTNENLEFINFTK